MKPSLFKSTPPEKKEKITPNVEGDDTSNSSSSSSSASEKKLVEKKSSQQKLDKVKEEKNQKVKKDKGYEENSIKCKRKSNQSEVEEPPEKVRKEPNINNNSDGEHEVESKPVITSNREIVS